MRQENEKLMIQKMEFASQKRTLEVDVTDANSSVKDIKRGLISLDESKQR